MSKPEDKYIDARDGQMMGISHNPTNGQEVVTVKLDGSMRGELICCPLCNHAELTMRTWDLRNGLVMGHSGMVADYHCRDCDKVMTLGFFNQPLGEDRIAARINWVVKDE